MKNTVQYRIFKGDNQYVASGIDLPVVTQGETLDELVKNIQEATELCLEGEDPTDFDLETSTPSVLLNIELPRMPLHVQA